VVTGHVDPEVLDRLAAALLNQAGQAAAGYPAATAPGQPWARTGPAGTSQPAGAGQPRGTRSHDQDRAAARRRARAQADRRVRAERATRQLLIKAAADLLSGPGGLAAYLRTRLAPDLAASISLPLDIGAVTDTIPVHLRRAVAARDRHCRFPGCDQPAAACQEWKSSAPRAPGRVCASFCDGSTPSENPAYTSSAGSPSAARTPRSVTSSKPSSSAVAHPIFHRVEGAPLEQIGCMHGMPGAAQLVGERVDPRGQPLCVVEEHYLSHRHPWHLSSPGRRGHVVPCVVSRVSVPKRFRTIGFLIRPESRHRTIVQVRDPKPGRRAYPSARWPS
jgi:hypothetical protein